MASSLTSALSSMEVMLDALMQRGIGKPEKQKPKEEEPPTLPTRPTGRGRLPSLQRPNTSAPWIHRPPLLSSLSPQQEEEDEEKCLVNLELERRAAKAEEEVKMKEEEMRQKEELIATLRQHIEHYECRLSECEVRMKSVEEELQKQITSLQMAHTAGGKRGGLTTTSQHRQELSSGNLPPSQSSARRQQRDGETAIIAIDECSSEVNELKRQSEAFEYNTRAVVEDKPSSPSSAKSVKELKALKRHFASWKKEYKARLNKTKAELKRLMHTEKKNYDDSHNHQRQFGWWRIKAPKCCRVPKCCSFKLPSPKACSCCFRRCW